MVGVGEAGFHMASLIADTFSVVTTLSRSIAPIRHNLAKYGLAARCARVRAAEVPVLALEEPGSTARATIRAEIGRALEEDGAEAIVLGCAGMTDLARDLEREVGVPVLDGVACAVALAESLARLGLRTSKRNTYAPPLRKALFRRLRPLRAALTSAAGPVSGAGVGRALGKGARSSFTHPWSPPGSAGACRRGKPRARRARFL